MTSLVPRFVVQQMFSAFVVILGLSMLSGCRSANDGSTGAPKPVPAQSFAREWSVQLELPRKDAVSELHLRDDAIFLYTNGHWTYAVNRASGQLMYSNPITGSTTKLFPPVVLEDRVIFPISAALEIYNLRGRKIGQLPLDYSLRGPATGSPKRNRIYVGTNSGQGGRIAAIDVTRDYAQTRWELLTFGPVSAAPALFNNVLFIGSESGRIYAVSEDRDANWPLEGGVFLTYGAIRADVKADEFGVYIASTDSKLYCVDRNNAKVKWQYFGGKPLNDSPVVTKTDVYQVVPGLGVAAINKTEGKYNREPRWIVHGAVQFLSEDDRYAYVRQSDNVILAIDRATGQPAFKSKRADFDVFGTNAKGDGIIYAATTGGQVIAIRPVLKPGSVGELVLESTPITSGSLAMVD